MWKNFLINTVSAQVTIPNPLGNTNTFGDLFLKIADAVAGLVGAISVIMIIVAGILYLTSAGSPEKITTARKALFYAIMGIVITLMAGAIVFTIRSVLGAW